MAHTTLASARHAPAARGTARAQAAAVISFGGVADPQPDLGLRAESAILVDLDSKRVLWSKDGGSRRAPASLTKMVTAMVAADLAPMDLAVTVPGEAVEVEPNVMGLAPGEVVSVKVLLYGLFLDSGNDAAETLARTIVTRERFLELMNAKAAAIGMKTSHFENPTGLDDDALRSSAYDLAIAATAIATRYPQLLEIAGTKEAPIASTATHKSYDPYNLNKLLWTYPGATGLKTGFTDQAGGCVAATAVRGGRHLVVVVMRSDVFFTDAGRLLDYGFSLTSAGQY